MSFVSKLLVSKFGVTILLCAAVAVQVAGGSLNGQAPPRTAMSAAQISPDARALLDHTIQALGGSAFLNFKTMRTEGRAFSIMDGVAAGFVTYDSIVEYPDKRRLSYGMGKSKAVTLINNGDQGWEIDRYGLIEQSEKQISSWEIASRYSLENLLRLRAHEAGVLVLPGGQDFVENFPASILDIIDARQVEVKLYVNSVTYLPLRAVYRVQNPETHDWDEYADVYSDYHLISGIHTPMHLVRYVNDERVAETFRDSAQYNETCSPSMFGPPE
jgi:hypothetical protein